MNDERLRERGCASDEFLKIELGLIEYFLAKRKSIEREGEK